MHTINLTPQNTIRWQDYEKVCMALVYITRVKWDYLIDESELISLGMETFVKAMEKFEPHRGVSFGYFYHCAFRDEISNYIYKMRFATMRTVDPDVLKDSVAVPPTQSLNLECADILSTLTGDAFELARMALVDLVYAFVGAEPRQMRGILRTKAKGRGWSRRRYEAAFTQVQHAVMSGI
jgi:hypothetical protein